MSNRPRLLATCAFFILFCSSPAVMAQLLDRAYVSEVLGADIAVCGPILRPCRTFAFAATRIAARGRVIALTTGEYGPIRITKSMTIEAPQGVNALTQGAMPAPSGGSFAIEVAAAANDVVTLRGIKIAPNASGILFSSGGALYVEHCVIDVPFLGIEVFPVGFAGDVRIFIRDSVVSNASRGIRLTKAGSGSVRANLERSSMEGNLIGLEVLGAAVSARHCVMTRNAFFGVAFALALTEVTLEGCQVTGNDEVGIGNTGPGPLTVRVSNTTITDNQTGISTTDRSVQILTRGNNTLEANGTNGSFTGPYAAK